MSGAVRKKRSPSGELTPSRARSIAKAAIRFARAGDFGPMAIGRLVGAVEGALGHDLPEQVGLEELEARRTATGSGGP